LRSGATWSQQQKLIASGGTVDGYFGGSVSLSGSTVVIGDGGTEAAYVFVRSGATWGQQQELTASDGKAGDNFGFSVSVSGDTAVIGAMLKNSWAGAAYVFVRSGTSWSQQQELSVSDGGPAAYFGRSVSVSGDAAVIGESPGSGPAYVFAREGGVWAQQQELTSPEGSTSGDWFGNSVSVSGDTMIIGAPEGNSFQGAAYAFVGPRLGTNSLLVGSAAGTSSVVLSYAAAWTATANDSFLHISSGSASGTSSSTVVFTYDAFNGTGTRTGTLTIAGQTVTVTQAGANYIGPYGPVSAITLQSWLTQPSGIAVDGSGNVYFADQQLNLVEEWIAATQQLTGLLSNDLDVPSGVAVDGSGDVYVADTVHGMIKEWNPAAQSFTTLVGPMRFPTPGGPPPPPGLGGPPCWLALDVYGNVYVTQLANTYVQVWHPRRRSCLRSCGRRAPWVIWAARRWTSPVTSTSRTR
jgi:sugar lactone lactonase YvrE